MTFRLVTKSWLWAWTRQNDRRYLRIFGAFCIKALAHQSIHLDLQLGHKACFSTRRNRTSIYSLTWFLLLDCNQPQLSSRLFVNVRHGICRNACIRFVWRPSILLGCHWSERLTVYSVIRPDPSSVLTSFYFWQDIIDDSMFYCLSVLFLMVSL